MSVLSTWFETHLFPTLKFLESQEETAGLQIAHDVLTSAEAGASFPSLIALVVSEAKAKEIAIAEATALFYLNSAENNLIVQGTPAPITVAAVAAATPAVTANVA